MGPIPRLAAAVVVGLALLAPVPASALSEPRTSTDVCSVVPLETLALGAGNPLRSGIPSATPPGNGQCVFSAVDASSGIDVELTVSTHRKRDMQELAYPFGSRKIFERIYGRSKAVDGVGARAWYAYADEIGRQAALLVVKRNLAVQVVLTGGVNTSTARDQATAIATVTLQALTQP
jgi:hypothetical protein